MIRPMLCAIALVATACGLGIQQVPDKWDTLCELFPAYLEARDAADDSRASGIAEEILKDLPEASLGDDAFDFDRSLVAASRAAEDGDFDRLDTIAEAPNCVDEDSASALGS